MNQNSIRAGIYNTFKEPLKQQQFVIDNTSYQPNNTFYNPQIVSSYEQNMRDMSQFNLNDNFKKVTPIAHNQDFKYKEDTLYANLNANLLSETLTEYRLNVDSYDRNIEIYPDPFNYVVNFAPITTSGNSNFNDNNINKVVVSNFYPDSKEEIALYSSNPNIIVEYNNKVKRMYDPYILREFKNVKFVRLDNVVMPRFNKIIINHNWNPCEESKCIKRIKDDFERFYECEIDKYRYIPDINECGALFTDRFIMIEINELIDYRNLATNDTNTKAFTVFPDKYMGILYWRGNPYYAIRNYYDSSLGNISKLSFKFYNSWGVPITLNTATIKYETEFISKLVLYNPDVVQDDAEFFYINRLTEIIKAFVLINHNIKDKIKFYSAEKIGNTNLILNQKTFTINNIYDELDEFVTLKGFISVKKLNNKNDLVTININEYINNVIWYRPLKFGETKEIKHNLDVLMFKYKKYGFELLSKLKLEIFDIPLNHCFQNHLMFVISCATNELNTKIAYNSN